MKLELKHLAPYLPYDLKYASNQNFDIKISKWELKMVEYQIKIINDGKFENDYKPILRPLSDLTKEQREELNEIDDQITLTANHQHFKTNEGSYLDPEQVPYNYAVKLLEWHFDIFGLIDAGLAIDINTVKF